MHKVNVFAAVLGATWIVGCGPAELSEADSDATVTDMDSPIIGGSVDSGDPSVVAIFAHSPQSSSGSLCTGTVISSRAVLTAAHCVDPRVVGSGLTFDVYRGTNFGSSSNRMKVSSAAFDSAFDPGNLQNGHDIAVLTLAQATTLAPVPFNTAPLTSQNQAAPVRIVGYGVDSHNGAGAGTKRSVTTSIGSISSRLVQIGGTNQQSCHGDSGGPALQAINGVETVIGVTSFGMDKSSTNVCFGGGYDTRVDAYLSFVNSHL